MKAEVTHIAGPFWAPCLWHCSHWSLAVNPSYLVSSSSFPSAQSTLFRSPPPHDIFQFWQRMHPCCCCPHSIPASTLSVMVSLVRACFTSDTSCAVIVRHVCCSGPTRCLCSSGWMGTCCLCELGTGQKDGCTLDPCASFSVCAYAEVKGQPCMLFLKCYHFGGWGRVSQCLGAHQLGQAGWPASPRGLLVSTPPSQGVQAHILQFCFLIWGLNSGSRVSRQTPCSLRWMRIRSLLLEDSRVAYPSQWLFLARGHSIGLKLLDTEGCASVSQKIPMSIQKHRPCEKCLIWILCCIKKPEVRSWWWSNVSTIAWWSVKSEVKLHWCLSYNPGRGPWLSQRSLL